jgi:hypothetical protein
MLTKSQILAEFARLTAVFGPAKDRPAAMLELMVDEWHNALKVFKFDVLHQAVTDLISEKRYWPVLSEVKGACQFIADQIEQERRKVDHERQQHERAEQAARYQPDPYDSFRLEAMRFIKQNERTFMDFRDAGVRSLDGVPDVLAFDSEQDAGRIEAIYGDELNKFMGRRIELRSAPPMPNGWVHPKWERTKVFTRH